MSPSQDGCASDLGCRVQRAMAGRFSASGEADEQIVEAERTREAPREAEGHNFRLIVVEVTAASA